MISLALSFSKLGLSSDLGEATASGGDAKGAGGAFSVVLAALGTSPVDPQGEIAAGVPPTTQGEEVIAAAANGTTLPVAAESGKSLPDLVPGIAAAVPDEEQNASTKTADNSEDSSDAEAESAAVFAALPLLQLPAAAEAPETAVPAEAKPARFLARPDSRAAVDADGAPLLPPQAPAKHQVDGKAEAPAVALHVAPQADRSSRRDPKAGHEFQPLRSRETIVEGMVSKAVSADPGPQAPTTSFTQGTLAEVPRTGHAFDSAKPAFQSDALQDLTRIVDRLAAAREAFAPTAAALAVKHAEFGELSLRFDQHRDGHLAVQLSANDPEAHRAVAAAVSDRSASAMADSHTGTGQSPSQSQARGTAAERDANGNGNTARHEQAQQRRPAAQDGQPGTVDRRRPGIFA